MPFSLVQVFVLIAYVCLLVWAHARASAGAYVRTRKMWVYSTSSFNQDHNAAKATRYICAMYGDDFITDSVVFPLFKKGHLRTRVLADLVSLISTNFRPWLKKKTRVRSLGNWLRRWNAHMLPSPDIFSQRSRYFGTLSGLEIKDWPAPAIYSKRLSISNLIWLSLIGFSFSSARYKWIVLRITWCMKSWELLKLKGTSVKECEI